MTSWTSLPTEEAFITLRALGRVALTGGPTHLFRSCVWSIAPMIAKRASYSRAGDGEIPGRNILVVGGRRHVDRSVESWLSGWLLLRAVSDSMMTLKLHWVL